MAADHVLLLARVIDVLDSIIAYPSCNLCYTKLLIDPTTSRYHCMKCYSSQVKCRVQWRYRLVLSVSDGCVVGSVVTFGKMLEPYFGKTATEFRRSLDDLEGSGYPANELLQDALTRTFVGKCFYFGFKVNETPTKVTLGTLFQEDPGGFNQTDSDGNDSGISHILAYQMIASQDGVYATVTDHMRLLVKQLRHGYEETPRSDQQNRLKSIYARSCKSLLTESHLSCYGSFIGQHSVELSCDHCQEVSNNGSVTKCLLNSDHSKTSSELGNLDRNEQSTTSELGIQPEDEKHVSVDGITFEDSSGCNSFSNISDVIPNEFQETLCENVIEKKIGFSDTNNDISNTSRRIDRELQRRHVFHTLTHNPPQLCTMIPRNQIETNNQVNNNHIKGPECEISCRNDHNNLFMPESEGMQLFFESQCDGIDFSNDDSGQYITTEKVFINCYTSKNTLGSEYLNNGNSITCHSEHSLGNVSFKRNQISGTGIHGDPGIDLRPLPNSVKCVNSMDKVNQNVATASTLLPESEPLEDFLSSFQGFSMSMTEIVNIETVKSNCNLSYANFDNSRDTSHNEGAYFHSEIEKQRHTFSNNMYELRTDQISSMVSICGHDVNDEGNTKRKDSKSEDGQKHNMFNTAEFSAGDFETQDLELFLDNIIATQTDAKCTENNDENTKTASVHLSEPCEGVLQTRTTESFTCTFNVTDLDTELEQFMKSVFTKEDDQMKTNSMEEHNHEQALNEFVRNEDISKPCCNESLLFSHSFVESDLISECNEINLPMKNTEQNYEVCAACNYHDSDRYVEDIINKSRPTNEIYESKYDDGESKNDIITINFEKEMVEEFAKVSQSPCTNIKILCENVTAKPNERHCVSGGHSWLEGSDSLSITSNDIHTGVCTQLPLESIHHFRLSAKKTRDEENYHDYVSNDRECCLLEKSDIRYTNDNQSGDLFDVSNKHEETIDISNTPEHLGKQSYRSKVIDLFCSPEMCSEGKESMNDTTSVCTKPCYSTPLVNHTLNFDTPGLDQCIIVDSQEVSPLQEHSNEQLEAKDRNFHLDVLDRELHASKCGTPGLDAAMIVESQEVLSHSSNEKKESHLYSRKVRFDKRLQRVSSCHLIDIKMQLNISPSTQAKTTKSCLRKTNENDLFSTRELLKTNGLQESDHYAGKLQHVTEVTELNSMNAFDNGNTCARNNLHENNSCDMFASFDLSLSTQSMEYSNNFQEKRKCLFKDSFLCNESKVKERDVINSIGTEASRCDYNDLSADLFRDSLIDNPDDLSSKKQQNETRDAKVTVQNSVTTERQVFKPLISNLQTTSKSDKCAYLSPDVIDDSPLLAGKKGDFGFILKSVPHVATTIFGRKLFM
ncbi:uncharacterized protein LOC127877200 isoform X2 [Dreissena polymorpha]|nr:uncharacterized protein LOC127877200 isoform X2 [Dreissena polymorpha]XP_052278829.1 uncharacterized protein LOC127877200 isoform X2 [Dreissena polymorpha]XP_052278830.1 uncharacterized protein LOC127877200 isoform X2 [Dreissena polymorpha]